MVKELLNIDPHHKTVAHGTSVPLRMSECQFLLLSMAKIRDKQKGIKKELGQLFSKHQRNRERM